MYLADTNIIVDFLNGNKAISERLVGIKFYIPNIVIGELYYGCYNSKQKESNMKFLSDFLSVCNIINSNEKTAEHYGKIKFNLKKIGKPIPENDIWIAALAKQYECVLITNDAHFKNIRDLKIEYCPTK